MDDFDPAVSLAIAVASETDSPRRKRSKWSKEWFLQRSKFGHTELLCELRDNDPKDFQNFLRMDVESYNEILQMVEPLTRKKTTNMREPISPTERLSITLRYLATGNTFEDLKFVSAIAPQTIGKIVIETCEAIISCLHEYIKMPQSEDEWLKVSEGFRKNWNFPHALGAVDGKHVAIKKPPGSGSYYFNYKKFFSIVLMAVVDSNYEFIVADVGVNGRVSDGGVISHTDFGRMMEKHKLAIPPQKKLCDDDVIPMPFVFLGDDAFSLTENFMKPYPGRGAGGEILDNEKNIFNYRLSRARRVVENAFGILVSRFGVFQRQMQLSPKKVQTVTLACCYLHNFLRRKSNRYIMQGTVDWEDENGTVQKGSWRESQIEVHGLQTTQKRNASDKANDIRDLFRSYFCTKGSVTWQ